MRLKSGSLLLSLIAALALATGGGLALYPHVAGARGNASTLAAQAASHTITVSGHGEVKATPDQATITLGVQTQASDAQSALANNATKMNAVIAAVEGQGVASSHIQTSNLSLYRDSQRDAYVVDHQVTVQVDDVSKVGAVLDAAVGAGANNSWGVSFGLQNESTSRSQALAAAVADARSRADSIARALGVTISGVSSAGEATYNVQVQPVPALGVAAPSAPAATQVQPGQLTVTADVNVVYTFS